MREILFRGKRADTGEWVYGYYSVDTICSIDGEYLAPVIRPVPKQVYDDTWNEILPDTICEYTGLTDCNGKKFSRGIFFHSSIRFKIDTEFILYLLSAAVLTVKNFINRILIIRVMLFLRERNILKLLETFMTLPNC